MKTSLLVTYHYPPSSAVGGVRPSKFARYFGNFGWSPIVLTTTASPADGAGIEGQVVRVREWPHPLKAYQAFREWQLKRLGRMEELQAKAMPSYATAMERRHPRRLASWIVPLLNLPDRETGWIIPAIGMGRRLIRVHGAKCLITTGPPFSCHLIGLALKSLTGLPWIAEFRDPWNVAHKYQVLRNSVSDAVESRLIKRVMRRADRIISVTSRMSDEARKEHCDLNPAKFLTLTSGFDPADYDGLIRKRSRDGPVVFAYFGTFYHGRTPEPFLRGLRSLLDDGTVKAEEVKIRFVGHVERAEGRSLEGMLEELKLQGIVSLAGPVSRQEALRQTLEADVVLVLNERHPIQTPFKFYEALGAGAIILNVGSAGAVSDALTETGQGVAVDYRSMTEVRRGILMCIERSRQEPDRHVDVPWRDPALASFSFEQLTARLAGLLDSLEGSSQA